MDHSLSVSDFWQQRCMRLRERVGESDPLLNSMRNLWSGYKAEVHQLIIPSEGGEDFCIKALSIQQGPTRCYAFYEWQHLPDTFRRVHLLRSAHAHLRCALAESEADKIIGSVSVNLQELKLSQVARLCEEMTRWWERNEGTFLSPFSQMAFVLSNWLEGLYGDPPLGCHPSLDPLREIDSDMGSLMSETAKSLFSILKKELDLDKPPRLGVVGFGAWAESVTSELRCSGAVCDRFDSLPIERERDIYFLMHLENTVTPEIAGSLKCKAVVELLPNQINPDSDDVLHSRGVMVIPDLLCTCTQETVEDWWIGGSRVPGWEMAVFLKLSELWDKVRGKAAKADICHHDAALLLAFELISDRWERSDP